MELIAATVLFGAVVSAAAFLVRQGLRERAPWLVPVTRIAELPEGTPGRLVGKVVCTQTIKAPISGRACVYFDLRVTSAGGEVLRERAGVPFAIDDGTGRAIIDPTHTEVRLVFDAHGSHGSFDEPHDAVKELLRRQHVRYRRLFWNRPMDYDEAVVEPGETVTVYAQGVREPDPDGAGAVAGLYRDGPPTRLHLRGTRKSPLLISDDPALIGDPWS